MRVSTRNRARAAVLSWAIWAPAAVLGAAPDADAPAGVVVETVGAKSGAENAGLQPGDILLTWFRPATPANPQPARGTITSPFDFVELKLEQINRGPLRLEGTREGQAKVWELAAHDELSMGVRPSFSPALLAVYQQGKDLVAAKKAAEGAQRWGAAGTQALQAGERAWAVWLLARTGDALVGAQRWQEADETYATAMREAERHLPPGFLGQLERGWADVFRAREEWPNVEEHARRALAFDEKRGPDSLAVAQSLLYLGNAAFKRTKMAEAEEALRRGVRLCERWAPDSSLLASLLNGLGIAVHQRREYSEEEDCYRRALAIHEKRRPEGPAVAVILMNMGLLEKAREDLDAAERYYRKALAIDEKTTPDGVRLVRSLLVLGDLAMARRQWVVAEDHYRRALALLGEKVSSAGLNAAALTRLGEVSLERGELAAAEDYYRRALAGVQRTRPGTENEAIVWHGLALLSRRRGRMAEASDFLLRALDSLESWRATLGGSPEHLAGFFTEYASYYHESMGTLIALGRPREALEVLERWRARSLLAMLAERELGFRGDLPPELAEERKRVDAEYDRVQASIAPLDPDQDGPKIQERQARLSFLRSTQEEIAARIRQAAPRLASIQYPQPLDLPGVRGALDPGTLLLAYSVGEDETLLFAVEAMDAAGSGLSVFRLPVGEAALKEKVEALRKAIHGWRKTDRNALASQAAELYDLLLRPAQARLVASARLLISPEGSLHSLPFAALVRRDAAAEAYLIEWKPLTVVASATVHAQLRKSRHPRDLALARLAAFGDPVYPPLAEDPSEGAGDAEVRSSLRRGFRFTPLPSTRDEVEGIAALFPKQTREYLGPQATEARVKALGREAHFVHFACHATLDERSPLNSGVALSIPVNPAEGEDNGLLQAWEIFDHVRLEADLVTLSACNTGLGTEMGGEGLLGLRRAFHYAGARSVLASLWAVSDRSTAVLMKRFYGHLKAGLSLDEALRAAQRDLIRDRNLSHPFRWAAFQLSGDWK